MSQRERENNGDGGRGKMTKKSELSRRWQQEQVKSKSQGATEVQDHLHATKESLHKKKRMADLDRIIKKK